MSEHLLWPAVRCPNCGTPPAIRVYSGVREDYLAEDPGRKLATYQCQKRTCGMIYTITVGALKGAA